MTSPFEIDKIKGRDIYRLYDTRSATQHGLYFKREDLYNLVESLLIFDTYGNK